MMALPIDAPGGQGANAPAKPGDVIAQHDGETKPRIKGLVSIQKGIASPDAQYPYAIQVTFQAPSRVSPFTVRIKTDKPTKMNGVFGGKVPGIIAQERSEPVSQTSSDHWLRTISPAVTPAHPFVVTLLCKTQFHILSIVSEIVFLERSGEGDKSTASPRI
ncbi:MAG: hypothetical protein ACLQVY_03505 [Limisphaerales bacterium]